MLVQAQDASFQLRLDLSGTHGSLLLGFPPANEDELRTAIQDHLCLKITWGGRVQSIPIQEDRFRANTVTWITLTLSGDEQPVLTWSSKRICPKAWLNAWPYAETLHWMVDIDTGSILFPDTTLELEKAYGILTSWTSFFAPDLPAVTLTPSDIQLDDWQLWTFRLSHPTAETVKYLQEQYGLHVAVQDHPRTSLHIMHRLVDTDVPFPHRYAWILQTLSLSEQEMRMLHLAFQKGRIPRHTYLAILRTLEARHA